MRLLLMTLALVLITTNAHAVVGFLDSLCDSDKLSEPECDQLYAQIGEDPPVSPLAGATLTIRGTATVNASNPRISRDGVYVGWTRLTGGGGRFGTWQNGDAAGLSIGPSSGEVRTIDATGVVAGVDTATGLAFRSGVGGLPALNFEASAAYDMTDIDLIVGEAIDFTGGTFGAFARWDRQTGSVYILSTVSALDFGPAARLKALTADGLYAAGESTTGPASGTFGTQAVLYDMTTDSASVLPFLPTPFTPNAVAHAISDDATLVVGTHTGTLPVEWTTAPAAVNLLPTVVGTTSGTALAIAADGSAVCGSNGPHAVAWDATRGYVRRLDHIVPDAVPVGCTLNSCTDMNAVGDRLVGNATCSGEARVYELQLPMPVPEPSGGLVAGALALVPLALRRRSNAF